MQPWILFGIGGGFVMFVIYPLYVNERLWGQHLNQGKKSPPRILLKGLGAGISACIALYGAVTRPDAVSLLITAGLFLGALADMVLEVHFIAGMAVFFTGHLFYLGAYMKMAPFHPASLVIFAVLLVGVIRLFRKELAGMGRAGTPYILYSATLLFMLSVALLLPLEAGARGYAAAAGAVLFTVSDLILARGVLSTPVKNQDTIIMGLYYGAQLLLSLTALAPWLR